MSDSSMRAKQREAVMDPSLDSVLDRYKARAGECASGIYLSMVGKWCFFPGVRNNLRGLLQSVRIVGGNVRFIVGPAYDMSDYYDDRIEGDNLVASKESPIILNDEGVLYVALQSVAFPAWAER